MSPFVTLSTILAVILFSHQVNHVKPLVEVSLILTSDDPNGTSPCIISGSQNSTVQNLTIWGSTTVDCSVNVTALSKGKVYLEVIDGQMNGTDYLYVERLGYEGTCKRFVAYTNYSNQDTLCPISFSQSNLTIQFRGDVTLQLTESSSIFDVDLGENGCEYLDTSNEVGTHEGQMSSCQRAKSYHQVITCEYRVRDEIWDYLSGWSYDTMCGASCPLNCNCTLGDNEIIQECLNKHRITEQSSVMIFPTNVSNLNLSRNSLRTLNSRAFVAIGNMIERLDLGFNKLILEVGMFQNLVNLLELGLTDNGLTGIPSGVFSGLKSLKQLWLYRNSLTVLEDDIFDGLGDLERLVLWGNKLSSIQVGSLANLTRLRQLYLHRNNLSVLEAGAFDGLGALEILILHENKLSSIQVGSLANLTGLRKLYLHRNNLSVLEAGAFDGLGALEILVLHENKLSSIQVGSLANLTGLRKLYLHRNNLSVLVNGVFDGLGGLEILFLQENKLSSIQPLLLANLTRLRVLYLNSNNLSVLEAGVFDGLGDLEELGLHDNKLTSIQVGLLANLTGLRELYLYRNNLSVLEAGAFEVLGALEILSLMDNKLSSIQVGLLDNLTGLRELHLYRNNLSVLEAGAFDGLGALEILSLHENKLSSIQVGLLANLTGLRELYLYRNNLSVLEDSAFDGLGALEILSLLENKLSFIQVGLLANLSRLKELHLYRNKLSVLENGVFDGLRSLVALRLWGNELSNIQMQVFKSLSKLIYLSLEINTLVHLDMVANANMCLLTHIVVHNNNLQSLHPNTFQCMTSLQSLLLDQNRLTYADSKLFQGLRSLKELVLADNFIYSLPYTIFKDLLNLHLLDLKNNRLYELPQVYHMTNLKEMKMTGNPLKWITDKPFANLTTSVQIYVDQPEVCLCYAAQITKCIYTLPLSQYFTCDRLLAEKAGVIIMFILGFGAIFANAGVLIKKLTQKGENKVQPLLIGNLAMSDLLMGIYMIIVASADVYYGNYFPINSETWRKSNLCRSAGAIAIISSEASVVFITLLSIYRFIGIRYPYTLHKLRVKSTYLTALFTWIFTIIIGIIASALAGVNVDFYDNSHVCIGLPFVQISNYKYIERNIPSSRYYERDDDDELAAVDTVQSAVLESQSPGLYFSVSLFLGFNLLCMLIIIFCYVVLVKTVSETSEDVGRSREMKEQIELTARVTAIVMTDVCCWLPIILMGILVQSGAVELEAEVYAWTVMFVLPFNSTINPLLYTYRTLIYEYWKKWRKKRKEKTNQKMEMKRKKQQGDEQEQRIKRAVIEEHKVEYQDVEEQESEGHEIEKRVKSHDVEQQQVQSGAFAEYEGEGKRKVKDPDIEERKVVVELETSV